MRNVLRGIGFFLATVLVEEAVRRLLMSRLGQGATSRLGRPELATYDGASVAGRNVKKVVDIARTVTGGRHSIGPKPDAIARPGWVGAARDASEMLLAVGAVLKTFSDFVHEDTKLQRRVGKSTTEK